jgi:hypothetical protein
MCQTLACFGILTVLVKWVVPYTWLCYSYPCFDIGYSYPCLEEALVNVEAAVLDYVLALQLSLSLTLLETTSLLLLERFCPWILSIGCRTSSPSWLGQEWIRSLSRVWGCNKITYFNDMETTRKTTQKTTTKTSTKSTIPWMIMRSRVVVVTKSRLVAHWG